jgi:hypothetical protein
MVIEFNNIFFELEPHPSQLTIRTSGPHLISISIDEYTNKHYGYEMNKKTVQQLIKALETILITLEG